MLLHLLGLCLHFFDHLAHALLRRELVLNETGDRVAILVAGIGRASEQSHVAPVFSLVAGELRLQFAEAALESFDRGPARLLRLGDATIENAGLETLQSDLLSGIRLLVLEFSLSRRLIPRSGLIVR